MVWYKTHQQMIDGSGNLRRLGEIGKFEKLSFKMVTEILYDVWWHNMFKGEYQRVGKHHESQQET